VILFTACAGAAMTWQEEWGFESWNVYRGDLGLLMQTGTYTQPPGSNPLAGKECNLDHCGTGQPQDPPPGGCVFFLVTGNSGSTECPLGNTSSGTPRENTEGCR
jgi:hypothetical protein